MCVQGIRVGDLTTTSLCGGVFVSTLTPFDETGAVLCEPITDQARRLSWIDDVLGIAVNTRVRERHILTLNERLDIIRCTAKGLKPNQILLACVGTLEETILEEVIACRTAGAHAVITFPAPTTTEACFKTRMAKLAGLLDRLALPVIVALSEGATRWAGRREEITTLALQSDRIVGFDMGADDNVRRYDQDYYALKALDRPLACLPSSEGALFHNLNTGGDGVLSSLAYIAPHEVAALYRATRAGDFPLAQAIHNRLAPLVCLLEGHDTTTRERLYREAAHLRGLLASPDARDLRAPLNPDLQTRLHTTLDTIALKPISWV